MTAHTTVRPRPAAVSNGETPLFADRMRVYAKAVRGPVRRVKWAVLAVCLAVYYVLPWLRWNRGPGQPDQAVLLDIWHERFYFLNLEFWPQDIYYLTGLLIMAAVLLFLVTSVGGRVWCGYACPQTVWTDLFMFVERRIQGDRAERMKRDAGARNIAYWSRKLATHAVWLGIAFWTGGAWIMYYVDAPTVVREFWTGEASTPVYVFTGLFAATTYLLAGWAREQVCTYMCPWPRFQSAMLDEQSITVTYQAWRGEPRNRHIKRAAAEVQAGATASGDCIDCAACVTACPTGIDIRDGIQLECINCGLCVDACNTVMDRIARPRALITWDTLARQAAKARGQHDRLRFFRTRTIIYLGALGLASTIMIAALALRSTIALNVEHDRAPLFVRLPDGSVRNGYTVRIVNKTHGQTDFELTASGMEHLTIRVSESNVPAAGRVLLPVSPDSVGTFRLLIASQLAPGAAEQHALRFTLRDPQSGETATHDSSFIAPATSTGTTP
jgi:cytochrome c oxidase accessory protein FixG